MRYIAKAAALVILLALLAPGTVLAGDYITDAVQALQHASVYVAPDTEGTDKDTAGILQTRLKKDDNIVLIMLPAAAEASLGEDINTIAARLSDELENRRIIGLAVGRNVVGYAPTLPAGVATDQMRRASSVSNDPITALGTFAQNMHIWQAEHPQPSPSPLDSPKKGGLPWYAWLGIAVAVFSVAGIVLLAVRATATPASTERTRFRAPDQVKDLLAQIARERDQVYDRELKDALYQMCVDIERYFRSSSSDKKRDAHFFSERLTEVTKVLAKYIDVQENGRYYNQPEVQLDRGKSSITDFAQYVLESIRLGNDAALVDYRVDTHILQAQRYR